ncbi:unnamed protein product [Lactuca saligna]|uniref:Uncharacterized protein n=1 Tax=Lactuca saligna TaxID=75948 RepID=A0AA35YKI2_LACSI|nr:unnamed protein product [Lactuca saligna]
MVRAPCFDKNGIKKGAWSKEEDNKLRAYIQIYGHSNWRELPKLAGLSRCGKSCRLRWMNYLRPNMKRGNFTKEEEDVIVGLHKKLGNKWSTMAAQLPGRSDNEIKNHWHTHLKNQVRKDQTVLKNEQFETLEPFKATPRGCQQIMKFLVTTLHHSFLSWPEIYGLISSFYRTTIVSYYQVRPCSHLSA